MKITQVITPNLIKQLVDNKQFLMFRHDDISDRGHRAHTLLLVQPRKGRHFWTDFDNAFNKVRSGNDEWTDNEVYKELEDRGWEFEIFNLMDMDVVAS